MKDIEELILKSIYGTLTSSEQEVLNVWLADSGNKKRYIRVRQRLLQRDAVQFLAEVDTEKALRLSHRRRHHRSIGIAAAIVGVAATIFFAVWLWPVGESGIYPAGEQTAMEHATITLASGEVLDLSSGSLTHQSDAEEIEVTDKDIHIKKGMPSVGYNVLKVPHGESYSINLPDGTRVWVNALSELKFPSSFEGADERIVELTGEGYFEVAHDVAHPFRVKTEQQLITVTGTAFNVSAYVGEISRTTLCEGSVEVKTPAEKMVRLVPGQQLSVTPSGQMEVEEVHPQIFTSWIHGIYYFENQTLDEVFKVLCRWYDIHEVVFDSTIGEQELFSGKLRKSDKLETILQVIERGSNRSIKYKDGILEIK